MSLRSKQLLFAVLCASFLLISVGVYMSNENVAKGSELLSEEAIAGKHLFQKYNCTACHQIFGLGGFMGPDLTNCMSSEGGPQRAGIWLRNGSLKMPNLHLSDREVTDLMAFLTYLDKAGTSPPKEYEIDLIGTINVKHYNTP